MATVTVQTPASSCIGSRCILYVRNLLARISPRRNPQPQPNEIQVRSNPEPFKLPATQDSPETTIPQPPTPHLPSAVPAVAMHLSAEVNGHNHTSGSQDHPFLHSLPAPPGDQEADPTWVQLCTELMNIPFFSDSNGTQLLKTNDLLRLLVVERKYLYTLSVQDSENLEVLDKLKQQDERLQQLHRDFLSMTSHYCLGVLDFLLDFNNINLFLPSANVAQTPSPVG
ncbi:hypothetical protein FA15DRAFT_711439 [Coprinopsis marcescibilis]|uniref:Uncharacterized protein n=1 Tax=Coprinopsis marcescibilis TaxID=230819 RepID=A0A5C3KA92_COPMA|nr:hypothetical protein FA15DRAFT_711439 [Coprinopsis marcescibilis]